MNLLVLVRVFLPIPITACYTACSVMETPNPGRYEASFDAVPMPGKILGCTICRVTWA